MDVLARRTTVLETVANGRHAKRDLVEALSVSRSTVDRAIRELETHDLVRRLDGEYRITLTGRLLLSARGKYVDCVLGTSRVGDLVAHLPADADTPIEMFSRAEAYRPNQPNPHRPTELLQELAGRAVRHRGVLQQRTTLSAREVFRERAIDGEVDIEYLVSPSMWEWLWSEKPGLVTEMIEEGGVEFYEATALPFDFGLLTTPEATNLIVVAYDDNGTLQGVLRSTDEAAVQWGSELFDDRQASATRLDPPVSR